MPSDVYRKTAEGLEKRLRLKTFPLAIKMLETEKDIPEGAVRPKRDLGYHMATCQGFAMSRRGGKILAMLKEDIWCSESVMGLGLAEPPQYFFDGHTRFPESVETLQAGSTWAHEFPRFEAGKYIGVVSSPLATANFEPDVVVLYCDSTQLKVMLSAAAWRDGHELTCTISGKGACVYTVVPVVLQQRCQVTTPCWGDKRYAMSQDEEMIFSFPWVKTEELLTALRQLDKYGLRLPMEYVMKTEYELRESYLKVGRMMGMDI